MITAAIYCVSLALLLMTSLRGWYTTGHDIQREYRMFELTLTNGNWRMSRFKDAYNAYFYRYSETPLLVVNTDEIDFVNKTEDFDNLVQQIARARQGTQVYVPLGSG